MGNRGLVRNAVLRLALVGFGNRAGEHLDALALEELPVEFRCVCDSDPVALKRARKRLPGVAAGNDLALLLTENPCDVVVLTLPPAVDLKEIVKVISRSPAVKAVLVEKPAANSSQAAAESLGALPMPVFIFHQMRLLPWAAEAKRRFREEMAEESHELLIEAFCYGKFLDQGLHVFDLACWITGEMPQAVHRVLAEHNPARVSARAPLPFDWRMDHTHAGPTVLEVDAGWGPRRKFSLKAGPSAASGWLGKGVRISSDGVVRLELTATGLRGQGMSADEMTAIGSVDDYKRATASVYKALSRWLMEDGPAPDLPRLAEHLDHLRWYERALAHECLERLPPPTWLRNDRPKMPVLVVIPLSDHRGIAEDCIRSWTQDQNCQEEDYELVVISNKDTKEIGDALRPYLRPRDRLIETNTPTAALGQGDMEEYVIGIESGESEWIFLTEPHCEVPPDIVSEIRRFFATSEAAGFCTNCLDCVDTHWGKMEALYSAEGFAGWKEEGNWGKMIMRGFGIRRTAYEMVDGFRLRYGRFSEWLLAADLHRRGLYLDFASQVYVKHHYTLEKKYLDGAIEEFVIGQARYLREAPENERLPYFTTPSIDLPLPPHLETLFDSAARLAARQEGRFFPKKRNRIQREFTKIIKRNCCAFIVQVIAGRFPRKAFPFFKAYYQAQIDACLIQHLPEGSGRAGYRLEPGQNWTVADGDFSSLVEIHEQEEWKGQRFHWSKPVFAIPVSLPPASPQMAVLRLVLPGILGSLDPAKIFLITPRNPNEPVFPSLDRADDSVTLTFKCLVPQSEGTDRNDWFVVNVPALRGDRREKRKLGIPVSEISLNRQGCE